jgi:hypothetical protein
MGESIGTLNEELLQDYEKRAQELDDEDFKKLDVDPFDVKDI